MEEYLRRRFDNTIERVARVRREDLKQVNNSAGCLGVNAGCAHCFLCVAKPSHRQEKNIAAALFQKRIRFTCRKTNLVASCTKESTKD